VLVVANFFAEGFDLLLDGFSHASNMVKPPAGA
jgi:hypothetical protein